MTKFYDVDQNTDEWFALRAGKVGGSSIGKIMANYNKAFGQPAKDIAVKIAIEQITGVPQESGYSNEHMARGHEQEPIAKALYEQETFSTVSNGGFWDNGGVGVSPDGMVDSDGVIEIKSVVPHVHFNNVRRGGVDPAYKWQHYLVLMTTGRDWIDFVSFCSSFPKGKKLFIHRINKEDVQEEFSMIRERLACFELLVMDNKKLILESKYI